MCAAEANFNDLDELGREPDESHASRVPQSEGLEHRECGSDDADARSSRDPSEPDADRIKFQTEPPTPELKPLPANLRFLEDFKAQQMVIRGIVMKAQQTVLGDLIKQLTNTQPTSQKWALRPEPPDPPFTNQ